MKRFYNLAGWLFTIPVIVLFSLVSFQTKAQAVYTTAVGDWSQSYNSNSGSYQGGGGPALFSFGTSATNGQVNARLLTSNGTTGGAQQALRVGQKLIIRLTAPIGGGRSGIQSGGRIGFSLRNTTDLFDPSSPTSAFDRYASNALLRVEYQGGQSSAQLVDGTGTILSGMPGFTDFVNGLTYEVEMVSDREFNLQVVSGSRYNIRPMTATGTIKQMTIANLGENRDAVYSNVEVANTSTVSLIANTAETWTVTGIISNNDASPNSVTKSGTGTVILSGQNTYTGLTTISNGTLRLNAASDNTISASNSISLSSGGTLQISQNQTLNNLTIPAGATLIVDAGKTLTVTGTFTGGGTITNNGTISLAGTAAQVFPGGGTITAMNNLVINNNSASGVTVNVTNLTITGTLSFVANAGQKSLLSTGANSVTATTVSGASAVNGWVNGNLRKNIAAAGMRIFDIGDASNFTPVSMNVSASGFSAGELQASTKTPITATLGNSILSLDKTKSINRVWSVIKPAGSTFTGSYTGTFTYVSADLLGSPVVASLRTGIYNGSMWYYPGTVTAAGLQVTAPAGTIPMATNEIVFATATPVSITGVSVNAKTYNANDVASLNFGSATITGIINGNFVNINSGSATGTYNNKHVGNNKPVTITGVALSSPGSDANAYILSAQPSATGNINPKPLTVNAAPNTKNYDGSTSAAAVPTVQPAGIEGLDIAGFTETYDTKNAGSGKTLTASGLVSDGNSGNNYSYTYVAANTGVINNIPITNLTATPGTIACNGGTTTLTVGASGGDGALQYSLSGTASYPYQSSTVFNSIGAGTYTLTVKDEDNFTAQLINIIVNQPGAITGTVQKTNVSVCGAFPDGSITVTPVGGTGPFSYSWTGSNGYTAGNTPSVTGLPIGYYNVLITDANTCTGTVSNIHIQFAFSVFVTHSGSASGSCAPTGSILLYGNAGVQPYTYSINGNDYQLGNSFTGLAAGNYTGYVKDAAGCVSTKAITVDASAPVVVTAFSRAASSCASDGSIELFRTGGIPPYTYSIDNDTYQMGNKFLNLAAGNYTGYVKDSKGCVGTQAITITQGAAIIVTASKVNTSTCVNDGSFSLTTSGGVAPYTYSKDGTIYQSSNSFTGLSAMNYTGWVKDVKGCTGSVNVTINTNPIMPTAYATAASNCASFNGKIQMFRTGGVGPYTYSLDGNTYQESTIFSGLAPGTYSGYVKDAKTCVGVIHGIVIGPGCDRQLVSKGADGKLNIKEENYSISVYPNPSSDAFTLQLPGYGNESVIISVTDMQGRKLIQNTMKGNQRYQFGNNLKAGIYIVTMQSGSEIQSIKIVKD